MDVDNSKHPRENGERSADKKRLRLGDVEKEVQEWTLLELLGGLAALSAQQEDEIFELVSEIKKRLAPASGLQIVLSEQVKPFLIAGLASPLPAVRELTLSQLARTAAGGLQGHALLAEVWPCIVKSVADNNLKVATTAMSAILTVAREQNGASIVFSPDSLALFNELLSGSEVLRLRVLDLFTELSLQSAESQEQCKPFLGMIIQELDSKDLLQKMNVIELLEKIAKTEHGVEFIKHSAVMSHLQRLLTNTEDSGFSLLCGSALRLLSSIARKGTDQSTLAPIMDTVATLLESRDEACAESAISFVGAFGSTSEGQSELLVRRALLKSWFEHMTSTISLLRLSCLHSFAEILSCRDHAKTLEIFNVEDKGWDGSSTGEVMRTMMKFLDQPFPELRYATFKVIQSLTLHPWGVRAMFAYPGFFEFLINRSTDTTKVGKEWKYAIIESLVRNQEENRVREVLDDAASDTLLSYLAQGVFYQRGENATMIASKSG